MTSRAVSTSLSANAVARLFMAKNKAKRKRAPEDSPNRNYKPKRQPLAATKQSQAKHKQTAQLPPDVPFKSEDDILLIGEGDFSFALSLCTTHAERFQSVTATSFDSEQDVRSKYPQAVAYVQQMRGEGKATDVGNDVDDVFKGFSDSDIDSLADEVQARILFSIDATRLDTYRAVRSRANGYDWIVFQFPHVGGKSTDVNRQVRANQQLLVGFFEKAKGLLRRRAGPATEQHAQAQYEDEDADREARTSGDGRGGRVMVTLFEGEPYTLWNVRDLARHCGYAVERSWRFRWEVFPGYKHARTLGNVKSRAEMDGRADVEANRKKGAWRGEEREARSYAFYVKSTEGEDIAPQPKKRRKRKSVDDDSDSE